MFGRRIELFKVFGFPLRLDWSFIIIAVLVTWSLATALFPVLQPGLSIGIYWVMGVLGAVGLFGSIVVHELSHALVARRYDVHMSGITLFIFGGVAEMSAEPPEPKSEFFVAIAGPIASVIIAVASYALALLPWGPAVVSVLFYLAWINALLVVFNLIPAFPLDGGRVLRAALWAWKKDHLAATRISVAIGSAFGIVLIALGFVQLIFGNLLGAVWWVLIGLFLRNAAKATYQQTWMRHALQGEPVNRFMVSSVEAVPQNTPVDRFVDDFVYRYHFALFPMERNGELTGCVRTGQIKNLPPEEWNRHTVSELAEPCGEGNTVDADADAAEALQRMSLGRTARLMVVKDHHLVGTVSMRDLLRFLSLKLQLEQERGAAA